MRYLKLFEAFESEKLTKTLGFVNAKSRATLLSQLKKFCETIDFPFSKLSDEYFEYLPFKKALMKADMTGDEPCDATSKKEFPEYAVEGATCQNGKLKRYWGSRVREVVCPVCSGTGIKPKKSRLKLLKFWFDKEGNMITTTAVDGLIRERKSGEYPKNLSSFDFESGPLSLDEVRNLTTDQPVLLIAQVDGQEKQGVGYIIRERGNRTYVIQDFADGSHPDYTGYYDWRKRGYYSWTIGNENDYISIRKLKKKTGEEEEADPYTWNVGYNIGRWDSGLDFRTNVEENIKPANFAIVFDFGKLDKSSFTTKSEIRDQREEGREGALALSKDEDIRKQNIKRYMDKLAQSMDIVSDVKNATLFVRRYSGFGNVLFRLLSNSRYTSNYDEIIQHYYNVLNETDESMKQYRIGQLNDKMKSLFSNSSNANITITNNLKALKEQLKDEGRDDLYQIVVKLENLSQVIYNRLTQQPVETIEDLEVIRQKLSSLRSVLTNSRYGLSRLNSFVEYLQQYETPQRAKRILTDTYYMDPEQILENLPKVESVITKLI